jgi:4-hydroxyphenylpyruvate dioxygenase
VSIGFALAFTDIEPCCSVADFESFVSQVKQGHHIPLFEPQFPCSDSPTFECECATAISNLCTSLSISIPVLQPLRNFENFESEEALLLALDDAERWFAIAGRLGTDLVLVCSNFVERHFPLTNDELDNMMKGYLDAQVKAFRMLGERAAKTGIRVGYEALAWGTFVNVWEQCWAVVKEVDMPNVGIIFDSFNCLYGISLFKVGHSD